MLCQADRRRKWVMSTVRLFHRFIRFFGVLLLTTMAALDDTSLKSRLATKGRKRERERRRKKTRNAILFDII